MANSHAILFLETKERLRDQFSSINSLDTKAGISLGLIGALVAGLINSSWFLSLSSYLLLPTLLLLVIAISFLLFSLLAREFHKDPEPSALINGYEKKTEEETRATLIRNYAANFDNNKTLVAKKRKYMNLGFIFSFLSIFILCLSVLVQSFTKGEGM